MTAPAPSTRTSMNPARLVGAAMRPSDRGLRLILATGTFDRAYALFDRLRSTLILGFASDAVLDRYNEWAYSRWAYRPGTLAFQGRLYPWEEHVVRTLFPPSPARVLVGGAGAGREPFALAQMGYRVVAFEPAPPLAEAMATQAEAEGQRGSVDVFRGGYEDLPHLFRVTDYSTVDVNELGPFDAAILGWGSFSHLRTEPLRLRTLKLFSDLTSGPILASFIPVKEDDQPSPKRRRFGHLIARHGRDPDDRFSMHMGFQHPVSAIEVRSLAEKAGLEILELAFTPAGEIFTPYAVLRREDT